MSILPHEKEIPFLSYHCTKAFLMIQSLTWQEGEGFIDVAGGGTNGAGAWLTVALLASVECWAVEEVCAGTDVDAVIGAGGAGNVNM